MGYSLPLCLATLLSLIPSTLFPVQSSATRLQLSDGGYAQIQLSHPFTYFGEDHSSLYFSIDGFLSFEPLSYDGFVPNANKDIIAPLWTDIDTYTRGNISYQQATDGHLLSLATQEMNQMFPDLDFTASWVFVGTWEKVEFEPDTGEVTFQVVLISDDEGHSHILMNYGPIPTDLEAWMAGYQTEGNIYQYIIQTSSISELSNSTNVGIPGRWAFSVNVPSTLFPVQSSATRLQLYDGGYAQIQLSHPFTYFGEDHTSLYFSIDGFLSFEPLSYDGFVPNANKDIIAPLWTDIDTYTRGNISYQQATDGHLLSLATQEMNQMFPDLDFTASWVFVGTWEKVEFEPDTGEVTFQVVLISDDEGHSHILMNYGPIPTDLEAWMAGYQTEGNIYQYIIQTSSISDLSNSTNVGIPGRWAFSVNVPSTLFPVQSSATRLQLYDGGYAQIQLSHPFTYFGEDHSSLYFSIDGFLSFEPLSYDGFVPNANKDIIAPLWTDIDTYTRGNISYQQATDGHLLSLATQEMNQMFPDLDFTASWVFVGTWEKVEFEPDTGEVTFQVVLISDDEGHSHILMNYGPIPTDLEAWMAGYQTEGNIYQYIIQKSSISELSNSTNVGIPGRWAFSVNVPSTLFPVQSSATRLQLYDGGYAQIQLSHPFTYFGEDHSSLYFSIDGFLSFEPLSYDGFVPNANKDIIAPLWTDIDTYTRGNISYQQATDGHLLSLATQEMNQMFPDLDFTASWVFVGTWEKVEFEPDTGEVTFQVVLISDDEGHSHILMNYGPIPTDLEAWMAGYQTEGNIYQYIIQKSSISELSNSTNVGIPGRWAFSVNVPSTLFPVQSSATRLQLYDGGYAQIQLSHPFTYFGEDHSSLYFSIDGFLSFEPLSYDGFVPNANKDIIAPLWTDIDTYTRGNISYQQATDGHLLSLATQEMNQMFPDLDFTASWVFVGTWEKVEFEPDTGEVTFQVVLISDDEGHSHILMNYGPIPTDLEAWMAGYQTEGNIYQYIIQTSSISELSNSTNVGIPGRWAFSVNVPSTLFPVQSSATRLQLYDGGYAQIQLSHPFTYFGEDHSSLYFSIDGFLSFEPLSYDGFVPNANKDIIAPLWTDIDTYTRGNISYQQATDGHLLSLATQEMNQMFPDLDFTASWVFVGTWEKVEFEPDTGEVTFQVVLISDDEGHSHILMNYGPIPTDLEAWMAGYQTEGNIYQYIIQTSSISDLSNSTNVGIPGRWAFSVNVPSTLFPVQSSATRLQLYDGGYAQIQLSHPFTYFGEDHSSLYLSIDGFLSFEPLSYDGFVPNANKDIIAPLWTDIDTYTRGNISYQQATDGHLLSLATQEMNQMFPDLNFTASWVFVGTWEKVEFEPDTGEVTFQVVLISDDEGHSHILMNYGPIPTDPEPWMAGYQTEGNIYQYIIQTSSISDLSNSTNVGIPGRWAFSVNVPSTLFPVQSSATRLQLYDGGYAQIQLSHPFTYFGEDHSSLYLSIDGFLSFEPLSYDGFVPNANKDIIAPLWTDIDTYTRGNISYQQATDGHLLSLATQEMNQMFPDLNFTASWVFVGTWEKVEFEPDTGEVTFQVVLISDDEGHSHILMNYGPIPTDPEPWMAGYQTEGNIYQYIIQTSSISDLSNSTNVGIPGRWAFSVNVPSTLFPVQSSATRLQLYDGGYAQIQLSHPFTYFGEDHSSLYLSIDGFLSFEPLSYDGFVPNANKDIIAPLWTDIDTYTRGNISYQQATDGHLLSLATQEMNQMFPDLNFTASWVFVGTWEKVEFEPDTGEVTFQVVLISDDEGHSHILMNYGPIPTDPEPWMAGYQTEGNIYQYIIQTSSISDLSNSTNVGIPGRWAFSVNVPSTLFPVQSSATRLQLYDGGYAQIQLSHPFTYFGEDHSSLYFSIDGFLSFEPLSYDGFVPNVNKDIIAPLWTDIDTYTRGNISYQQATDGHLLSLATQEMNQMFPDLDFTASWVFVGTWEKVEFEPDTGEVTFQVVLISDDEGHSHILMNYGPIPTDPEAWMAGYQTEGNIYQYIIQTSSISDLSNSTNVGIPGRWAFSVNVPSTLFPVQSSATRLQLYDGGYAQIQLSHPFTYFGEDHSSLYFSIDGFLSFEPLSYDGFVPNVNKDIIAPLWTDIDTYTRGNISYQQATDGHLLSLATQEMNQMFPDLDFTASWVFVGTWEKVEFEPDTGEVTFQVVLISDDEGHSHILMNYGPIPTDPEAWMAGYQTEGNIYQYIIQTSSISDLSNSTNVGITGRWAFSVNVPSTLFPVQSSATRLQLYDGGYAQIQLSHPFTYFGEDHSSLYFSIDGFLSFEPLSYDGFVPNANKDIIAPLWTDIDTYTRGNISYQQATDGHLLSLATQEMNQMFPDLDFTASWVFVGTWEKVEFEPDTGEVTFQVVLISDDEGHSHILMNYGPIPTDPEAWMAGYQTEGNIYQYIIQTSSISDLSNSTNVGIPGRWAFSVNVPSTLFPVQSSATRLQLSDGGYAQIQLSHPFTYFGEDHSSLYFSIDGFLSFEPLSYDGFFPNANKDIIAPLWTDIDTYTRGNISYQQATEGHLLSLATQEMNQMFPDLDFTASWVFVGTWEKVEFEPDTGEVTFQVVLISDDEGHSHILMNYGPIPTDPEAWMAGYQTEGNIYQYIIQTSSISDLSNSTNVGIPGRWAFSVNVPSTLFPVQSSATRLQLYDGGYAQIQLSHPFTYFGEDHSSLYFSIDGFLSFEPLSYDGFVPNVNKDIIAPLWTDIDTYTRGNISYQQATDGHLLSLATQEMNQMFPDLNFTASWVFVGTWEKVEFEPDTGEVTFQVVLISDDEGHSHILMNYGPIPTDPEAWMAGYQTEGNIYQYIIQTSSISDLSNSTNVGIPGRWAFSVSVPPFQLFFPVLPSAVHHAVINDAAYTEIQLSHPFSYFGKDHSKLYLSMDGFLSFEPLSFDLFVPYLNKDIIAGLWTDIDTYTRGDISYQQATDGHLLKLASDEINHMFPGSRFSASWVFVATWEKVEFEPDTGEVTFQVVLVSQRDGDGDDDDRTFILMNYGDIPNNPQSWMAGYQTEGNTLQYSIHASSTSELSKISNVGIPGRWAFQVDVCASLNCTATEECRARSGIYGCACAKNNPRLNADTFDASKSCTSNSGSVSLSRCELFEAGFLAESLHLNDPSCAGEIQGDRVVFAFNDTTCGTTLKTNATHFIYENAVLMAGGVNPNSVVNRHSWLNVTFSCVYPLIQSISMPMSIHATGSFVNRILPGTEGTYQIRLLPYPNATYSASYSGEVTLEVNQPVFMAVEVDGVDGLQFSTVLDSCWATPRNDINYPIRWDLVINECPNPNDGTVEVLQNGISTSSHFSFRMFTFTSVSDDIFLHCQVHLCLQSSGQCALTCRDEEDNEHAKRRRRSVDYHDTASISMSF